MKAHSGENLKIHSVEKNRQDAKVTVFTPMRLNCTAHCTRGSEDLNETRMETGRGTWDVGATTKSAGERWGLRNATWRNISCVEGSRGRCIKDLGKTVDEEDYQLRGHQVIVCITVLC